MLKTGTRIQDLDEADEVFKICCVLHNILLEIDGLDEKWMERA